MNEQISDVELARRWQLNREKFWRRFCEAFRKQAREHNWPELTDEKIRAAIEKLPLAQSAPLADCETVSVQYVQEPDA